MNAALAIRPAFLFLRRAILSTLALLLTAGVLRAGVVLTGGGLTLVEEGGSIAPGNLAASGTAFAKDVLPGYAAHTIAHLNDQTFGNSNSWIGDSVGTFAGVSLGATPVPVSSIAFGRDSTGGFTDRTLGTYTLQYTTVANPGASTPDASWTTIGTLNYQSVGGTNFAFPSKRHRFFFNVVSATGIRLVVPSGGLATGTCIDELEVYPGIVVNTTADELDTPAGANISLREAVRDCPAGAAIGFAPALSGQTITLTLGSEIVFGKNLTIDASSLPAGVALSGGGTSRIFTVDPGQTVTLKRLTLTGGNGSGATLGNLGGAILNQGTLALTQCTLSGNSAAGGGGAIFCQGTLTLTRCTLSGNSAANGGAISNNGGTMMLTQCTLSGNSAATIGGAIENYDGTLTLTQCTLSGNSAPTTGGIGGAVWTKGALTLTNCILAGNTAPGAPDLAKYSGGLIANGRNVIGDLANSGLSAGANVVVAAPLLAPLGNYGGPTQTMPPLAGSPASDATVGSLFTTDQRGFPIAGLPDIGAAEGVTVVTTGADELDTPATSGTGISLREAVRDTPSGGIIGFAPALSGGTCTLGSEIVVGNNLTIDASSLPAGVTIDGGPGTNRIFYIPAGETITLKRLTLTGGNGTGAIASGYGGAIENQGTLALTRCTLSGNSATNYGGAIHIAGGTVTLTQCTLFGNSAATGGGAIENFQGALALTQCTLSGNSATNAGATGGAISTFGGTLTLTQCTLSGNSTPSRGGAIENSSSTLTLTNSIVAGNTAPVAGTENIYGAITQAVASITTGDPLLSPLGNYGGPTQTMPPLAGSPAIDATVGSLFTTDQRGFPIAGLPDIGAAEGVTVVTTGADELDTPATSGTGISLREAVRDTPSGGIIGFAPALSGGTCTLGSEIVVGNNLTIDASSLPAGVTIDGGPGTNRIFYIPAGETITLKRLTLMGGNGSGAINSGFGGAIENQGTLALTQCTLSGNSATNGGAIENFQGTLALTRCTLAGNSATYGGAIDRLNGTVTLTQCTLSGNFATYGGAIRDFIGGVTLTNSIVAGNTAIVAGTENIYGAVAQTGANIITGDPQLSPLGNYGGPTQTMALLPGSPAIEAAVGSLSTTDQRGFFIVGTPDIGAYEAGTFNSFATWSWETFGSALNFGNDDENDGAINGLEYATRRDPFAGDNPLSPTLAPNGLGGFTFQFRYQKDARDLRYIVQRSSNLALPDGGWVEIYRYDSSTGGIIETGVTGDENAATEFITLTDPTLGSRMFWRLRIEQVP